ncbi:MAG: hypothetical protein ABJ360_06290 [Roseobacter sp.]
MKRVPNTFFGVFLALMLVLTGQSMAVARGSMAAAGQMVICTGVGTTTVYIDAEGNPTAAPHVCPECIASLWDCVIQPAPSQGHAVSRTDIFPVHGGLGVPHSVLLGFLSRAPPVAS